MLFVTYAKNDIPSLSRAVQETQATYNGITPKAGKFEKLMYEVYEDKTLGKMPHRTRRVFSEIDQMEKESSDYEQPEIIRKVYRSH